MNGSIRWWFIFGCVFAFAVAACGDDEGSGAKDPPDGAAGSSADGGGQGGSSGTDGGDGSAGSGGCTVLTPYDTTLYFGSFAYFAMSAAVDAPLPGYAKTRLALELYDEGSGLPPGTFNLSQAPDDSYATCEHCVLLVAYDDVGQARRVFFQKSGTMVLEKLEWTEALVGIGSVSDVQLVEFTQSLDGSWHEVPGGACYELPAWSFDTNPVNGGDCDSAEDCPNEDVQVCDVETKKCVARECSLTFDPPFCDEGQRCMSQIGALIERDEGGSAAGACYAECSPASPGSCGAGKTCFPLGPTQEIGICLPTGGPAVGEPCTPSDLATSCADGAFCAGDPPRCQKACNYLSPPAGCPSGTYCSQINLCEPLAVGDLAPVGAICDADSPLLRDCGPEGDLFRGLCMDWFPEAETKTCERVCKTGSPQCGQNEICVPTFSNTSIGLCHVAPTCGDGKLDTIGGEYCDDGNTTSGDGCSADCKTPELSLLCAKAEPLAMGINFGTNEKGPTGYPSLCDPYVANPAKLYSFLPPAAGKLTLELESATYLGLSVLSDCADGASELGCKLEAGRDTLHVNFATVPTKPVLVTVRAAYPLSTGSFALSASFVPAVCGDGQVGGPELCDDGNQTANDGCSADCSTIEWTALCAGLPALSLGEKLIGNVDAGTQYFDTSGFCAYQSGRERAYSYTASAAGTLKLTLTSTENLNLAVLDACGPVDPSKLLSCSNSGLAGETETLSVPVTAGQKLTVVVQGHSTEDGGSYELQASFTP